MSSITNRLTIIDVKSKVAPRFMILDAPNSQNIELYVKEFKSKGVTRLVRCCEEVTYDPNRITQEGLLLYDLGYPDGHAPPKDILQQWFTIVQEVMLERKKNGTNPVIAVHCLSGLGRAASLVALALIEYTSLSKYEIVQFIRTNRRGAINKKQFDFIDKYKKKKRSACIIS